MAVDLSKRMQRGSRAHEIRGASTGRRRDAARIDERMHENSPSHSALCQAIARTRSRQLTERQRPTFQLSLYLIRLILRNRSDARPRVHLSARLARMDC